MSREQDRPVILGIDFGTTNTCVAHLQGRVPRCVPTDKGGLVMPSVVALSEKGDDLLVGAVAKDQMVVNPRNTIHGFKRLIGRQFHSPTVQELRGYFTYEVVEGPEGEAAVVLGGKVRSVPEIASYVLGHCKRVSEAFLERPVAAAVVAVPAYFSDSQRQAVKEAGRIAGLEVLRVVNEPTAAALAYGFNRGFNQKILIFDMGGGTFDLSVVNLHGKVFEVLATGGDMFLGGQDFDQRIIDHVLEEFREETRIDLSQSPIALQRIKSAAEAAKIDLSMLSNVMIELPYIAERRGRPVDLRLPLSRERLNALSQDLVDRAFAAVIRTLEEKNIDRRSIDEVLLVGGQSRMPLVQGRTHQFFGKPPRKGVHPDESVALGAALLGDSLHDLDSVTLIDVLSVPIGIALPGGRFRRIIDRNTTIPSTRSFRLPPGRGDTIELDVYQGDGERIVDNEYLGTLRFPGKAGGARVQFLVDEETMLRVSLDEWDGPAHEVLLATRDTPSSLREAWAEELRRRTPPPSSEPARESGFFGSLRRIFGG